MTLARRLVLLLLVCAPLVWLLAVSAAYSTSRHEINELFDTQQIRIAQVVVSTLPENLEESRALPSAVGQLGSAQLNDLTVAVWTSEGRLLLGDREGSVLPFRRGASGFVDVALNGRGWHVYYLPAADSRFSVAVGQSAVERDEVLAGLLAGQLIPWALMLPVLLVAMAVAVRHVLKPVRVIASDIEHRRADDLRPVAIDNPPAELKPLVAAMNRLFARIGDAIEYERRLTADAAHELRTPLAALRSQWEAANVARDDATRANALGQIGRGIERMGRLVEQLLTLAAIESSSVTAFTQRVRWDRVVEQALSDCLPVIERTGSDVEVRWPQHARPMPIVGDEALLSLMLRNLIDNAVRYSPERSSVTIRFDVDRIVIDDSGPGLDASVRQRLGDRFYRPAGQKPSGSGLGVSIVRRVAALHGIDVAFADRTEDGDTYHGLRVTLRSSH